MHVSWPTIEVSRIDLLGIHHLPISEIVDLLGAEESIRFEFNSTAQAWLSVVCPKVFSELSRRAPTALERVSIDKAEFGADDGVYIPLLIWTGIYSTTITNSCFRRMRFGHVKMDRVSFVGTTFDECSFNGGVWDNVYSGLFSACVLNDVLLQRVEGSEFQVCSFNDCQFLGQPSHKMTFNECSFSLRRTTSGLPVKAHLIEAIVVANAPAQAKELIDLTLERCTITLVGDTQVTFTRCTLVDVQINVLGPLTREQVLFQDCHLTNVQIEASGVVHDVMSDGAYLPSPDPSPDPSPAPPPEPKPEPLDLSKHDASPTLDF